MMVSHLFLFPESLGRWNICEHFATCLHPVHSRLRLMPSFKGKALSRCDLFSSTGCVFATCRGAAGKRALWQKWPLAEVPTGRNRQKWPLAEVPTARNRQKCPLAEN